MEINVKYFDIKEYNMEMLYSFSKVIPLRFEKSSTYLSEKSKLQCILGGILIYQNMGNIESDILYNRYGKPYLKEENKFFNISHTGDYVVFVKDNQEIGIDIERVNERNINIIKYAFNDKEIKLINADIKKLTKLWTIKEAVYKASGADRFIDFKSIDTSKEIEIEYNDDRYNVIGCEVDGCWLSVASIKKYEKIKMIKEMI